MQRAKIFSRRFMRNLFCMIIISGIMSCITTFFFGSFKTEVDPEKLITRLKWQLILMLPAWALLEEALFRFMPFALILIWKRVYGSLSNAIVLIVVVFSSVMFGIAHGDVRAICVQGVIGLYLSYIFWRYSFRLKNFAETSVGLLASTITHCAFNYFVLTPYAIVLYFKHHF